MNACANADKTYVIRTNTHAEIGPITLLPVLVADTVNISVIRPQFLCLFNIVSLIFYKHISIVHCSLWKLSDYNQQLNLVVILRK